MPAGRPSVYSPESLVRIAPNKRLPLHQDGARREILISILDKGGICEIKELAAERNEELTRTASIIGALVRAGWLTIEKEGL